MKTSESISEIAKALAKAQSELKPCPKNGFSRFMAKGKEVTFEYSTIDDVLVCAIECLSKNEICVLQGATTQQTGVMVETRLIHSSGQWISFEPLFMPCSSMDSHGIGSATTYGRRYSLCAAIGISGQKDEDGNIAMTGKDEIKQEDIQKALDEPVPFIPLSEQQKEQIRCLVENIEDKEWINRILKNKKINDLTEISASGFYKCIESLEKKVTDAKNVKEN